MPDFADLGLAAPLLGALATEGYTTPTPIQSRAIPTVLGGRDLCGIAQTGSGKTAAFALPILQRLSAAPQRPAPQSCRALVLSPTRVSIRVIPVPSAVSVGAAANPPPKTILPRLGQSLSKQALSKQAPERGRTGAIRRRTSDRSERRVQAGAAGSIPAFLQQRLERPVTPASIRHRSTPRSRPPSLGLAVSVSRKQRGTATC